MATDIVSVCVDDRMPGVIADVLRITNVGRYHPIPAFGCSLGLDHEFGLFGQVIGKLHSHRVSIYDHLGCKAYHEKFGRISPEEERQIHISKLREREMQLRELFPGLTEIRLYLLPDVHPERIEPKVVRLIKNGELIEV